MEKLLSKTDTARLKGFAILMILYHHLFGRPERLEYCTILGGNIEECLLFYSALAGKVGVSVFLILSGYGLNESLNSSKSYRGGGKISTITNQKDLSTYEVILVRLGYLASSVVLVRKNSAFFCVPKYSGVCT